MKKILIILVCLCMFIPIVAFAGQETICNHNNYEIMYNSNDEVLRVICVDCGESHEYTIDSKFVEKLIGSVWEE